jgi:hypothetical protein
VTGDDPPGRAHRPLIRSPVIGASLQLLGHFDPAHTRSLSAQPKVFDTTAISHRRAAIELHDALGVRSGHNPDRMWLRATGDGWSLVDHDGQVLFHAMGLSGRRECLEFARERGVLAVLS